jgi:hypothetical protein
MKFGVREICDVVLKAKAATKIGNKVFYKNEPVIYFDSLKTSSMEGAATTVYAQGGRGNSRLVAWEGERTITFTMEDALISPEGFMILSGAGLIEADEKTNKVIYQHVIETTDDFEINGDGDLVIYVEKAPHLPSDQKDNFAYVMIMKGGEAISEPFIPIHDQVKDQETKAYADVEPVKDGKYAIIISSKERDCYGADGKYNANMEQFEGVESFLVDYYTPKKSGARQIEITADKFGGNYYLEASTLFRDTNGVDMPAEFIVPNCKIQSNFTFTMASSGDPSTFTFTMDAFPDYTRFDKKKKVLAAIQIIDGAGTMELHRHATAHEAEHDDLFI